jgi:fucose 4-O-acetylase-like acetyltransferase
MEKRLYYLDHLRVFLTVLVIAHHTAIAYGAGGSWIFIDADSSELTVSGILLTMFTAVNQSFFMGLFFFLSGYFTPGAYERKGTHRFLKERFIRLGIPLLFYVFLLGPVVTYIAHHRRSSAFTDYYRNEILTFRTIHIGPLWFVETLLYFSLLYVLFRFLAERFRLPVQRMSFPASGKLAIAAAILGAAAFAVRLVCPVGEGMLGLQFGYFPSYIVLFIAGMMAYRQNWLSGISDQAAKRWLIIACVTIPVLPIGFILTGALTGNLEFEGGWNVQAFLYAMWEPFVGIGLSMALLNGFKHKWKKSTRFRKALADSAYTVYIIHPAVIVGLSLMLVQMPLPSIVKFLLVTFMGTVVCFLFSCLIIKLPGVKRIL